MGQHRMTNHTSWSTDKKPPPQKDREASCTASLQQEKPFSTSLLGWPSPFLPLVNKNTQEEMRTYSSTFLARQ